MVIDIIPENDLVSEEYLRIIVESSLDGITVVDNQGRFEFANDSFFRIIEWSKEEIIGNNFLKIIPKEMNDLNLRQWNNVQEGIPDDFETKIITKSGKIKYVKVAHTLTKIKEKSKVVSVIKDITLQKELEIQLKEVYTKLFESEKYLRTIIESSLDGIAVVDEQGRIEFGNDSFFNVVGWPRDELIGHSFIKMLTDDTKELYLKIWHESEKTVKNCGKIEDVKILTRNGEVRYLFKSRVSAVINGDNKFIFIAKDISEKKKLELALKESEAKFRDLFENAQYAMYVVNPEGYFLKMNQVGLKQLGYSREEVIGSHISKFVTPESLKIVQQRQKKRILGEILDQTDVIEMVCKSGKHLWVDIKSRDIKKNDTTIEIHGIARDITENIILKKKLNKSNKQQKILCHLIRNSRGGITRSRILNHLIEKSNNANQLATALNLDYKTIRHHLDVLSKHGLVTRGGEGYTTLYFISKNIESDLIEELKIG